MDKNQARTLIHETFNNAFDKSRYIRFVKELLNEIDESKHGRWAGQMIKGGFGDDVKYYERIGTYTAPDGEKIDILVVYLKKESTLERARTKQRNFVAHHLKTRAEKDAGLVAFVSPNTEDWRFSLVKMEYHLEQTQEGKVKVEEDLTPAKRFSFIVGKNENSHTAQKQLLPILEDDKNNPTLKEIEKAFSIEAVTKEFFNKYKDLFLNFKEEFDKILEKDKKITADFSDKGINTADFAKKLLGQIVFLYFLQRKGWLGVNKNMKWGSGPKDFLRTLFDKKYADYKNFFNDILEPLFYEALATDRGDKAYYSRFDCRIPFLNGGLFEPIQNYDWENTDIIIPNDLFSNDYKTKEGDIGSGILDFFDRYNFTIKEDEPLEKEVAIDPEMLGKVFENLLEIKDRKSKGAYYTPREIVHYMCQESLINYLATEAENKLPREDIETFIHLGDFAVEHDMAKTQGIIKDDGKYKLPQSIHENAELIDKKLADITVCDPAIGSGAFPVGMMNEIVRARGALNATKTFKDTKSKRTPYSFKRHAIQNSLYGVDIDPGAVEIAKLRLWLSLVVDEEEMTEIKPLPNLDYKIMQGNSLLEEYEGIKLFDESLILDTRVEKKKRQEEIGKRKSALQQEYFKLHSEGKLNEIRKSEIEKEMKALQKEESALTKVETGGNSSLFDQESIAKKKAEELNRLHKEFFDMALKSNKAEIKKSIDELEWELIEETLKEHGKEKELPKLQALRRSNNKPFFLWKLHFAEVFQKKGGFDVVIANPPYGAEFDRSVKDILKQRFSYIAERIRNSFLYFIGLNYELAKTHGVVCLILPNEFLFQIYMTKARNFLLDNTQFIFAINVGEDVFEAIVPTCIMAFKKGCVSSYPIPVADLRDCNLSELSQRLVTKTFPISSKDIVRQTPNAVFSFDLEKVALINKYSAKFQHFENFCEDIANGVSTSCDNLYIVPEKTVKELNLEYEYLKPCIRGGQLNRYFCPKTTHEYLLYITDSFEIKKSKNIYNYLLKNKETLIAKSIEKKSGSREWHVLFRSRYPALFTAPKILIRQTADHIIAAGDNEVGYYPIDSVNIATLKAENRSRINYFLGLLNSSFLNFFYREISQESGRVLAQVKPQRIRALPVVEADPMQEKQLTDIVDKITVIIESEGFDHNVDQKEKVRNYEREIDNIVYRLFGLTQKEIQIIESSI